MRARHGWRCSPAAWETTSRRSRRRRQHTSYVGQTRTYWIAADDVVWDYAPTGINQITGEPFDEVANVFVQNGPDRIGKVYLKALYREYTENFAAGRAHPATWARWAR